MENPEFEVLLKDVSVLEFEKDSLFVDLMHANLSTGSLGEWRWRGSVFEVFRVEESVFFRRTAAWAIIEAKLLESLAAINRTALVRCVKWVVKNSINCTNVRIRCK